MANTENQTSQVFTFTNHPPLKIPGAAGKNFYQATEEIICDLDPQWGHNFIGYFVTRSGKRIYVSSYNSGETYNGRDPKTIRRVERDPMKWLEEHGKKHSHGHLIDPSLILDLENL